MDHPWTPLDHPGGDPPLTHIWGCPEKLWQIGVIRVIHPSFPTRLPQPVGVCAIPLHVYGGHGGSPPG